MRRALITGSFDPPTKGHLDIIKRSAALFDEVVVCLCVNSEKRYMFDAAKRRAMLDAMCASVPNVRTDMTEGLVADYVKSNGIDVIVKGARNAADFEYEVTLAKVNSLLCSAETLILPAKAELSHVSSLVAREMIKHSANVEEYLSDEVIALL